MDILVLGTFLSKFFDNYTGVGDGLPYPTFFVFQSRMHWKFLNCLLEELPNSWCNGLVHFIMQSHVAQLIMRWVGLLLIGL